MSNHVALTRKAENPPASADSLRFLWDLAALAENRLKPRLPDFGITLRKRKDIPMRIATWNVERLRHRRDLDRIYHEIEKVSADIIVLTETDALLHPDYPFSRHTLPLSESRPGYYRETENRVSVFSRYRCLKLHKTYDAYTAVCTELETERGNLLVYGTIMGILGNRHEAFMPDLKKQMEDIRRLSAQRIALCVIGDYNLSFCDSFYYTRDGRNLVAQTFQDCGLRILTGSTPECIDHIAITEGFAGPTTAVVEWNLDKRLSDHKGIVIETESRESP